MHECHVGTCAEQLQGCFGRGVFTADDYDPLSVVRMRLVIEMRDVGQVLAGNSEVVRVLVVPDRQDDGPCVVNAGRAVAGSRRNTENAWKTGPECSLLRSYDVTRKRVLIEGVVHFW